MIVAKPVIDKQYWILQQGNKKVGVVEADTQGYLVRIGEQTTRYRTIPMVRRRAEIEFAPFEKKSKPTTDMVHGYRTGCRAYNPMWDVKNKLPLFTKSTKSKSWFAAGWYAVKQHRTWRVINNPKLILLERYQYQGPFHDQESAHAQCN